MIKYRSPLAGLVWSVVVIVGCVVALRWAYGLLKPMLWLVPVISVVAVGLLVWRRWSGRSL